MYKIEIIVYDDVSSSRNMWCKNNAERCVIDL